MGAVDAYGGDGPNTPHMRPVQKLAHQASSASLASACSRATSTETESTDGGGDEESTDDEPTVRPTWSVCGGDDTRDDHDEGATDGECEEHNDGSGDLRMASPFTRTR
jgi:hypothetical protein